MAPNDENIPEIIQVVSESLTHSKLDNENIIQSNMIYSIQHSTFQNEQIIN